MGSVRTLLVGGLVWVTVGSVGHAGETRTWVDVRGNQVPGELVEVTDDHMVVLLVEGSEVSIPWQVFSDNDQNYLRQQLPKDEPQPVEPKEPDAATTNQTPTTEESEAEQSEPDSEPSGEPEGADLYQPPSDDEAYPFYCSVCDGDIPASIGLGDSCPHCGIEFESIEDEDGNLIGSNERPWWLRLSAKAIVFGVVFLVSTAWKFRRVVLG